MNDSAVSHYENWIGVLIWVAIYGIFIFFTPFYKKSQRKPATAYMAFIIAYALEMFGIPMSMYFVAWAFGKQLPDGFLWGHTLNSYIGHWGMYLCIILNIIGGLIIISGWRRIYKDYWKHESGKGKLVYPLLVIIYFRLAKKEEQDMLKEFGTEFQDYISKTNMFIPNFYRKDN